MINRIPVPPKFTKEEFDVIWKQEFEFESFVCALVEKDASYFINELVLKGLRKNVATILVNDLVKDLIPTKTLTYVYKTILGFTVAESSLLDALRFSEDIFIKTHGRYVNNQDNEHCLTFTPLEDAVKSTMSGRLLPVLCNAKTNIIFQRTL